jgi:hypothetical protein
MRKAISEVDLDRFCITPEQFELILYEDAGKPDFPFSPVVDSTTKFDFSSILLECDFKPQEPTAAINSQDQSQDAAAINHSHVPPATFTADYSNSLVLTTIN